MSFTIFLISVCVKIAVSYIPPYGCPTNACETIKCISNPVCRDNENFVKDGGYCGCCPICIPFENISDDCPPGICNGVRCQPVNANSCTNNDVFVIKGGFCGCCDACVPRRSPC